MVSVAFLCTWIALHSIFSLGAPARGLRVAGELLSTQEGRPAVEVSEACALLRRQFPGADDLSALFQLPPPQPGDKPLVFLHIPKNAGSAINSRYRRFLIREKNFTKYKHQNCPYWHLPPRYWGPYNPYKDNKTFCVVRHPVDKAVSEFKMRHPKELNQPDTLLKLEKWLRIKQWWSGGGIDCHMVPQYEYIWDENGQLANGTDLSNEHFLTVL